VICLTTVAVVEVGVLADLLRLAPFAPAAWLLVIAVAIVATCWSEPLKSGSGARTEGEEC
jgi:hypothetical protein